MFHSHMSDAAGSALTQIGGIMFYTRWPDFEENQKNDAFWDNVPAVKT